MQVLAAEEERQKVRLEKLAKKTPAQRLAAAKARREAAAAAAMVRAQAASSATTSLFNNLRCTMAQ